MVVDLHGNGGSGNLNRLKDMVGSVVLVAPSGYERSWNIIKENSKAPDTEFLLIGVLPSLFCYLAGCAFLFLHYKAFHPWRNLFTWQRKQETRTGLQEETPCWEEVR